jgi:hypothetical protein
MTSLRMIDLGAFDTAFNDDSYLADAVHVAQHLVGSWFGVFVCIRSATESSEHRE